VYLSKRIELTKKIAETRGGEGDERPLSRACSARFPSPGSLDGLKLAKGLENRASSKRPKT
jgi:hypothetical protein